MRKIYKCNQAGNDFLIEVLFTTEDEVVFDTNEIVSLCNRHTGIGADGMIFLFKSEIRGYDFKMRLFNSDGSEAEISGNGLCCVGKTLYDADFIARNQVVIDTLAGVQELQLEISEEKRVRSVSVKMPPPNFIAGAIPVAREFAKPNEEAGKITIKIGRRTFEGYPVSIGNPHFVIFTSKPKEDMEKFGYRLEHHKAFPERANIQFVKLIGENELEVFVHERGAGPTLACGSGATACSAVAAKLKLIDPTKPVRINMPGGTLMLDISDMNAPILTGSPKLVARIEPIVI